MAESPSAVLGLVQLLGHFGQTTLSQTERSVVLLTVSFQNISNYCMAGNSAVAQMFGVPADIVDRLRKGEPLPDPKLEALHLFTQEIVREHGRVSDETTQRFFEAGFTKAQLFEVILGIALETMNNYTDVVARTPLDEPFQECAWSRPG